MGVKGLQTFLENFCPDACHRVNIDDLILTYKRETGRQPVIVVDGSSCLRHLYGNLDWVYGGQLKEYMQAIRNFVEAFETLGARLIVFFDGPTLERKRPVWIHRRHRSLKDVYTVFDSLSKGHSPSTINPRLFQLPAGLGSVARFIFKDLCNCEVFTSVRECDEEIAAYALKHHCFAILGQDTDYVIFEGAQYYFSILHLNLERMTTLNYNRWALARRLRILPTQLPLLATFVGNDIIQADDLKSFHQELCRNPHRRNSRPTIDSVIYQVANFIRTLPQGEGLFLALPSVSRRVFGSERLADKLETSIKSYSILQDNFTEDIRVSPSQEWDRILKTAHDLVILTKLPVFLFSIVNGLPYESSTAMEDFRKSDIPPAAVLYRKLRQRVYGILLHEYPQKESSSITVPEWCMSGEDSLKEVETVPLIPVRQDSHPGLLTLWDFSQISLSVQAARWGLFAWGIGVSEQFSLERLKQLPTSLVAPAAVLFYLHREVNPSFLQPWEVEALIAQAVSLPSYDIAKLAALQPPKVDVRAVQLAAVFMRGASHVQMLVAACGYPIESIMTTPFYFFDGKLFHGLYLKAKCGAKETELCNHQAHVLEQFQLIKDFVFK